MIKKIKEKLKRSKVFINATSRLPSWMMKLRKVVAITMEVSSACNLNCVFCPVGNKKVAPKLMSIGDHKKIIDLLPKSVKILRYAYRGDPTMNPDFVKMIKYASQKGFKTDVSTNGMIIDRYVDQLVDSGLDRIIFAIDGATQEVQSKYRINSDLEKIKSNIRLLVDARKNGNKKYPREIVIQTVVSRNNENQINEMIEMSKDLGVDKIKFKTMAVNLGGEYLKGKEFQESFLPENKNYWRKGQDILLCPTLGETAVLYNGDVSICCSDFGAKYVMGNIIKENSFDKVVYGRRYNEVRKKILKKSLPICKNCPITGDYWISEISKSFIEER